jgi:hypothetical protein
MPEINALEPVSLRQVWPDEARDFTPWLADNLHLLGAELNLALELVEVEATLPEAGRVDIIAQQVSTMAKVVIENQLEVSDDSHCLRLLGYAANADANILVWVARDFTPYHRSILSWLNESDGQRTLFEAVCQRICDGEAFPGSFFGHRTPYLFIANYKYSFMTPCDQIDLDATETEHVLNRASLYHDRRDFHIQEGDTGRRDDYPGPPTALI